MREEKWITELQMMRMCTMHDDENVNRAVAGFSWICSNSRKDVLRACLNEGVEFTERMSKGRLFQTVGPVKEKDLSPKVFLFVVGTQSMELSEDERS